jgi:hypothetical protein
MGLLVQEWVNPVEAGAEYFTSLGIGASLGRNAKPDKISAHKWFNIAAARGSCDAARLRAELAAEMTRDEISLAQRLAREYLAAR